MADTRSDRIIAAKRAGLEARLLDHMAPGQAAALLATYDDEAAAAGITPEHDLYWRYVEEWLARHSGQGRGAA